MSFRGLPHLSRAVCFAAAASLVAAPAFGQTTTRPAVPPPTVVNPPAGYPYPNVADSPAPSSIQPTVTPPPDASAAPDAAASGAAAPASGGAAAPDADPTSKAPNTYGSGGAPPRLNISTPQRDDSPIVRVGGSYTQRTYAVSLRALGLYRHDPLRVRDRTGKIVSYAGVALQFLPGVSALVHPNSGGGDSPIALARATVSVVGSDGKRASFASGELIDAQGNPRVFLVDQRSGIPLGAYEGPFRVVSPADKTGMRWIRNVVEIDVNR